MKFKFILAIIFFSSISSFSQEEKKYIHEGNKNYEKGKFDEAEKNYRKAVEKNNNSLKGSFNMADALYKEGKYPEAAGVFESITGKKTSSDTLARAYHNLGNSLLRQKKYEESINAYKKALKSNPDDEETRYNLAYSLQMLKKQQQQQKQNQQQQQKQNQQQNQNQNDQKKDQNDKDKQQQAKNKISPEDAKRLLEALNNDEKKTQEKLKKEKTKGDKKEIEKDW